MQREKKYYIIYDFIFWKGNFLIVWKCWDQLVLIVKVEMVSENCMILNFEEYYIIIGERICILV